MNIGETLKIDGKLYQVSEGSSYTCEFNATNCYSEPCKTCAAIPIAHRQCLSLIESVPSIPAVRAQLDNMEKRIQAMFQEFEDQNIGVEIFNLYIGHVNNEVSVKLSAKV